MKTYIITVINNRKSVAAAQRCAASIPEFSPRIYPAVTPKDNPLKMLDDLKIPRKGFEEDDAKYSVLEPTVSAFLSHHSLWMKSIEDREEIQILEHDAIAIRPVPEYISYNSVVSLGQPSYGQYNTPNFFGTGPLVSKPYFPGAHAYRIKPKGAKVLVAAAKEYARTTDVMLDIRRFTFLEEYYPWPFMAKDDFTTLQKEEGCLAKHGYNEKYEILSE